MQTELQVFGHGEGTLDEDGAGAMNMHIDVGTVLQGTVCELYSNLVTRPTGAAVRSAIEQQVCDTQRPSLTTIDFSRVNLLDYSCADEIVAKLLLRFVNDLALPGYLTFRGLHDGHIDPIEAVLERHELALVSWYEGEAELFGHVSELERLCWDIVRDHGPTSVEHITACAGEHAATFGSQISRESVEIQLGNLLRRRLLMHGSNGYSVPQAVRVEDES